MGFQVTKESDLLIYLIRWWKSWLLKIIKERRLAICSHLEWLTHDPLNHTGQLIIMPLLMDRTDILYWQSIRPLPRWVQLHWVQLHLPASSESKPFVLFSYCILNATLWIEGHCHKPRAVMRVTCDFGLRRGEEWECHATDIGEDEAVRVDEERALGSRLSSPASPASRKDGKRCMEERASRQGWLHGGLIGPRRDAPAPHAATLVSSVAQSETPSSCSGSMARPTVGGVRVLRQDMWSERGPASSRSWVPAGLRVSSMPFHGTSARMRRFELTKVESG
jgi:hypothetical protein